MTTHNHDRKPNEAGSVDLDARVRRSLVWRIAAPTAIAVVLATVAVVVYTPRAVVNAALDDAIVQAERTARQMQTLRAFYSKHVVTSAEHSGATASPSYKGDDSSIPVPTTFLLDVAKAYSNGDERIELVSPYPWPTREQRRLDKFQRDAWDYLSSNPEGRFVRREELDGRETLRVAVGDSMGESCVSCHNAHPESPRTDWKVGDVRGLIEVERPIDVISEGAGDLSRSLATGVVLSGIVLLIALLMLGTRMVRPLRELTTTIATIGGGRRVAPVPHTERGDEIGAVARALEGLRHLAHHDTLTGLPNRMQFHDTLTRALLDNRRRGHFAVLCLDLDRFKAVNDTLGHPIGDALLIEVAARLRECVRGADTVARLGGDEFAVLQETYDAAVNSDLLAKRIIDALSRPYLVEGHHIVVGASVGIALHHQGGAGADELLKQADMALYRSKDAGRGKASFFTPEMDETLQERRALETDLRAALANDEFELHYQPIVDLKTNRPVAFEALLRWNHPVRGRVGPDEFIPLAEETGEITAIGAWVLRTACRDAASWPDDISVAVNLSPIQFKSTTLPLHVLGALNGAGLAAHRLELEITEAVVMQDTEATLAMLRSLKILGVSVAMDDFGTGYSSLSYLRQFPFDKIKVDRSFVRDIDTVDQSAAVVRAVLDLSVSFGMRTTAEGVETEEQLAHLRAEGCGQVQGYLFSRPRPGAEVPAMIDEVDARAKAATATTATAKAATANTATAKAASEEAA